MSKENLSVGKMMYKKDTKGEGKSVAKNRKGNQIPAAGKIKNESRSGAIVLFSEQTFSGGAVGGKKKGCWRFGGGR